MSEPQKGPNTVHFSSDNSLVVVFEGPGDNTRRPLRPNILRTPPEPAKEPQPPTDQPSPPT
jgi:hypothetical protein